MCPLDSHFLKRSSRGRLNPDGKNLAFFSEYAGGVEMLALTLAHKRQRTTWFGELALRPRQPVSLPAGDVVPAFLNAATPSLARAEADALPPGAIYHSYDRLRVMQFQAGVQRDWPVAGGVALSAVAEVVGKHVAHLPDPARRRYGRAEVFGNGPVYGVCTVTSPDAARQCSFDGYTSRIAAAYRVRLDARKTLPDRALLLHGWALLTHDVKGWSHDGFINEGRRVLNLGVRVEYRQRYSAEAVYAPIWGGAYNAQADRDQLLLAVGMRF